MHIYISKVICVYIYIHINQRNLYLRGDTTWWSFAWNPRSCQWLHASDVHKKTRITRITRSIKYPAPGKKPHVFFCVIVSHFFQLDFFNDSLSCFGSRNLDRRFTTQNWTCKHCCCIRPCCCWSIIRGGCWSQARSYGFPYIPTTWGDSWS